MVVPPKKYDDKNYKQIKEEKQKSNFKFFENLRSIQLLSQEGDLLQMCP